MTESLDAWFKREILSHEEMLMRFLLRVWPRRHEVADIRQETYARVYEAAQRARPQTPKAFLFATARHLMTDRIRRERIVSIHAGSDSDFLNVLVDEVSPEQHAVAQQELVRLAQAFDRLSQRCREVLWMRRVRDLPQKEVARRLGLAEKTVEKHTRDGARLLAHYLRSTVRVPSSQRQDASRAGQEQGIEDEHEAAREHGIGD